jgi:hypothetical protein
VERHDLPLALVQDLVAAGEAFNDQAAVRGCVALADDVAVRRQGPDLEGKLPDRAPLLVRDLGDALQLADESLVVVRRLV